MEASKDSRLGNTAQETESNIVSFIDSDGVQLQVTGWYRPEGQQRRYLVKFTRPGIEDISTHALIEEFYIPPFRIGGFSFSKDLDIGNPKNQGGERICLQNIVCVLDITWCSSYERECTAKFLNIFLSQMESLNHSQEVFILVEWSDEGRSR